MGYVILILGVALWSGAHLIKRIAPARRRAMGDAAKGPIALALVVSVVLMVLGYRWAEPVWLWYPPPFLRHINNLLVFIGFYLFASSFTRSAVTRTVRHPQLSGVKAWAVAHLLVVPTLAGLILFGGLLAWAVVSVVLINRARPGWTRPPRSTASREAGTLVIAILATAVVGWIHGWLGSWPFG